MLTTEASCNPFHLIFMTSALLVLVIFKSICVSSGEFSNFILQTQKKSSGSFRDFLRRQQQHHMICKAFVSLEHEYHDHHNW